ncbi:MAG: response regulator [Coriobacteriia bacterium]|nr:response regulator [Coriobacteriia bacterium]
MGSSLKEKARRAWLYAGLSEQEYQAVKRPLLKSNIQIMKVLPGVIAAMTMLFAILTYMDPLLEGNRVAYFTVCLANLVVMGLVHSGAERGMKRTYAGMVLFSLSVYGLSIYTGTIGTAEQLSVTFMVVIVVMPMILGGSPALLLGEMLICTVIFIILAAAFEPPSVAFVDIADALAFALISVAVNLHICAAKARHELSRLKLRRANRDLVDRMDTIESMTQLNTSANQELAANTRIFASLGEIYTAMYLLDLRNLQFHQVACEEEVRRRIRDFATADDALEFFATEMVAPHHYQRIKDFVSLDTLQERMSGKKLVTEEYESALFTTGDEAYPREWRQVTFIEAARDEQGQVAQVIFATRSIHDTKVKQLRTQAELEQALIATENANKAKTNFLFNMSHDIRTPMNAIMGFRDLLEKHQDDPVRRQDYLDKIASANDVLLSIINNVLEMTRIEQSSMELDEIVGNVEQYCDGITSMFAEMMQDKQINFVTQVNVEHDYVYCDVAKSRDVFINLISNAYKYTKPGGNVIWQVDELPSTQEGIALFRTTVADDGIGMSEEFLPHVFDEFSRENTTTDAGIEGTGLGMPIVKQLVSILGGSINVKSHKGQGTIVEVVLPHRIAEAEDCLKQMDRTVDMTLFRGKRVLLAEDNDLNAEIAIEILQDAGFQVDRAADGRACFDLIVQNDSRYYDLVLMDIQMPVMNGYEATVAIRRMTDPIKASVPIVAMTANAFEEDRRDAFRSGMNGHLAKPINVKDIYVQLTKILQVAQASDR